MTHPIGSVIGSGDSNIVYVDWFDETITFQDGDSTWSDATTPEFESPSGTIAINTRSVLDTSLIILPDGSKLSERKIQEVEGQIMFPSSLVGVSTDTWSGVPYTWVGGSGSYGMEAFSIEHLDQIVLQTGQNFLFGESNKILNGSGVTAATGGANPRYARCKIVFE